MKQNWIELSARERDRFKAFDEAEQRLREAAGPLQLTEDLPRRLVRVAEWRSRSVPTIPGPAVELATTHGGLETSTD